MKTTANEIQSKLHKGIVTFTFKKKDGTLRTAKGTLKQSILESKVPMHKPTHTSSPNVQVFFDLEKEAFRSFVKGTEEEIINFVEA